MNLRSVVAVLVVLLITSVPLTAAIELKLQYDANGNLVTGDGKYRVYNSQNQLASIYNGTNSSGTLLETYIYHPTEERILVKKAYYPNGTVNVTSIYLSPTFVRTINATGTYDTTYVYHDGQLVAQNTNGTTIYIHTNHEGSSTVITGNTTTTSNITIAGTLPQQLFNHTFCTSDQGYSGYDALDTVHCSLNKSVSSGNIFGPNESYESNYSQSQADFNITLTFVYPGGSNNKFYPTVTCGSLGTSTNKFNFESQNSTHFHLKADRSGFSATTNFLYNTTQTALFETNFTNNVSRACIGSSCTGWETFTRDAGLEDCFGMSYSSITGGAFQITNVTVYQNLKPYNTTSSSTATVLERSTYSPFGELLTGGTRTRFGYEGKEADTLVGDTDFHFRKYRPDLGIFTQPDTVIQNVYDPQSLNRYTFERNNPYGKVDATGHSWNANAIPRGNEDLSGIFDVSLKILSWFVFHDGQQRQDALEQYDAEYPAYALMHGSPDDPYVPVLAEDRWGTNPGSTEIMTTGPRLDPAYVHSWYVNLMASSPTTSSPASEVGPSTHTTGTDSFYTPRNVPFVGLILAQTSASNALAIGNLWLNGGFNYLSGTNTPTPTSGTTGNGGGGPGGAGQNGNAPKAHDGGNGCKSGCDQSPW
jgi:RHS repeat-associated protein